MAENALRHVAIVMDGNGRWAKERGKPRLFGHRAGLQRTRDIINACMEAEMKELTLYAFSLENRFRPEKEVSGLMGIFSEAMRGELEELSARGARMRFVGEIDYFSDELKGLFREIESKTALFNDMQLNVAVNYGGRWDIAQAAAKALSDSDGKDIDNEELQKKINSLLCISEVDLVIRTGGEQRLSNFLLWQCAYSELYFTDVLWPNFDKDDLRKAFDWFAGRQRKFGMI